MLCALLLGFGAACSAVVTSDDATGEAAPTVAAGADTAEPVTITTAGSPTVAPEPTTATSSSTTAATTPELTTPPWLGSRPLETNQSGFADAQPTPPELIDRRLPTIDVLAPPPDDAFYSTISALEGEPLERSTWEPGCPVEPEGLSYLTLSFWGFDGKHHTGEMIVAADQAEGIVSVFEKLHAAKFPIEEMRIATPADLAGPPTGDTNNTTAFVCRAVTGGSRFSEHAYGLAIDINSFHNPYERDGLVLPELAGYYLDRSLELDGMILSNDVVVNAFADIGWSWGGNWRSLKDYQHFSLNNR